MLPRRDNCWEKVLHDFVTCYECLASRGSDCLFSGLFFFMDIYLVSKPQKIHCFSPEHRASLLTVQYNKNRVSRACFLSVQLVKTTSLSRAKDRHVYAHYKRVGFLNFRVPCNVTHCMYSCHLALFASPSGIWGSGNWHKSWHWLLLLPWVIKFFISDLGVLCLLQHPWNCQDYLLTYK